MKHQKLNRLMMVAMLCIVIVIVIWYPKAIYIRLAAPSYQPVEINQDIQKVVYFWGDKKHTDFFRVGAFYQLQHGSEKVVAKLFSITYATSRPGEMKLGLYSIQGDASALVISERVRVNLADISSDYVQIQDDNLLSF